MGKKLNPAYIAAAIIGLFVVFSAKSISHFPPVYADEVVFSVHGHNLLSGLGHRYSLYDDIFDRSVYAMRDALPDITRFLYTAWVALWMKIFSVSYSAARASSIAAGALGLFLFFLLGRRFRNARTGLAACALCATSPIFLFTSTIVRPEILLFAVMVLVLWLMQSVPERGLWKSYMLGVLMGLSSAIHWNAIATGAGLLLVYALLQDPLVRVRRTLGMMGGMLTGGVLAFSFVNPEKFLLSLRTVNYLVSTPPPILGDTFRPWRWFSNILHTFFSGYTSFMNFRMFAGWSLAIACSWIGFLLAILVSIKSERVIPKWKIALLAGWGVTFCGFAALLKRQEWSYSLALLPFLIPVAADAWNQRQDRELLRWGRRLSALCLIASFLLYGRFAVAFARHSRSFDRLIQDVQTLVPQAEVRVAGPNVLWFVWPSDQFRDLGAVITSGWYVEGRKELAQCLAPWKPDILVIDQAFRKIVANGQPMQPFLQRHLPANVSYVGSVPDASGSGSLWEFYRLEWTRSGQVPAAAKH